MSKPRVIHEDEVEILNHWIEDEVPRQMDIHRVQADQPSNVIILSHMIHISKVHFYGRCTVPHTKPQCQACDDGTELRVRFYFAVQHVKSKVIECMELTKPHLGAAEDYEHLHKTMRGCNLRARRRNGEKNGKIATVWSQSGIADSHLPASFDVDRFLRRLWKLSREDNFRRDPSETPEARREVLNNLARNEAIMPLPPKNGKGKH